MAIDSHIIEKAAAWHARLQGDAPDFDGFSAWLEADPVHVAAYDQMVALDDLIDAHRLDLAASLPANDDAPRARGWRLAGLAATLAVFAGGMAFWQGSQGQDRIVIATGKGQAQTIELADATQITVDEASQISYKSATSRSISLARGTAHFAVHHDSTRPFSVIAGGYQIRDLGTEFSISTRSGATSVSVANGLVEVSGPTLKPIRLAAGERADMINGRLERTRLAPDSVASWRQGRLVYDNAPLWLVASDISRYAPGPVHVSPAVAGRRFSGVLTIGDGSQLAATVAGLVGIPLQRSGDAVRLGAGG